ncbi:histidinol-phosphatase (PHP family) [Lewinella aquimaris]|uniref:Histidinol-phosphatase n=1 Tax=Neolewinella aquimaris TaxID=1835722 RepID=A0A840E776_9BACT|nr:histidinol-phosphatase [Neolewinella aquimaris]MBB4079803.1 histidinol-phosphatase (PHP family) [Neolewinella aquimaris]
MKTNHHAHTRFSDGVGEPADYVRQALTEGLTSYGFSDHAPIPSGDIGSMKLHELGEYGKEIDRLRDLHAHEITLHKSLEVDYLPGVMNVNSPHILAAGLDYTIGAVHYVGYLSEGEPWSFQRPNPVFERGISTIFGDSPRRMVERYYALVREMVELHPPDVVAHLDRIKRRNVNGAYWDEHADWYVAAVEETLDAIAGADLIMEVNTRGIYLNEISDTYPSYWIVRRAHARGIKLQVNSDAHQPRHIVGGFRETYAGLRSLGVEAVWEFKDGGFRPAELLVTSPS